MYYKNDNRQKWKKRLLVISYLLFILAEGGEIFLTLNVKSGLKLETVKVEKRVEMPLHLPEESKVDFLRPNRSPSKQISQVKISRG